MAIPETKAVRICHPQTSKEINTFLSKRNLILE